MTKKWTAALLAVAMLVSFIMPVPATQAAEEAAPKLEITQQIPANRDSDDSKDANSVQAGVAKNVPVNIVITVKNTGNADYKGTIWIRTKDTNENESLTLTSSQYELEKVGASPNFVGWNVKNVKVPVGKTVKINVVAKASEEKTYRFQTLNQDGPGMSVSNYLKVDKEAKAVKFCPHIPRGAGGGMFIGRSYVGAGNWLGTHTQAEGLVFKAQPAEGYKFDHWAIADNIGGTTTDLGITTPTLVLNRTYQNKVITPVFQDIRPALAVVDQINAINATGDQAINYNDSAEILAARKSYNALAPEQKAEVSNLSTLTEAEAALETFAAPYAFYVNVGSIGDQFQAGATYVSIVKGTEADSPKLVTTKERFNFKGTQSTEKIVEGLCANNINAPGANAHQWGYLARPVDGYPRYVKLIPLSDDKVINKQDLKDMTIVGLGGHGHAQVDTIVGKLAPGVYDIVFNANGGTIDGQSTKSIVTEKGKLAVKDLPTPTREEANAQYTFLGWFTQATGGKKITKDTAFNESTPVYAHWDVKYKVAAEPVIAHGDITAVSKNWAAPGETVEVTVAPENDYQVVQVVAEGTPKDVVASHKSGDVYQFTMPSNAVTVTASFKTKEYAVTCASAENGTLSAAPSSAEPDALVTVTTTPAKGYKVASIFYHMDGGRPIYIDGQKNQYVFMMPKGNVQVGATFMPIPDLKYPVAIASTKHGKVAVNKLMAKEGDKVTILASADFGYELDKLSVTDKHGTALALTSEEGNTLQRSFIMTEDGPVMVTATFKLQEGMKEASFQDVPADAWYTMPVTYVAMKGIMEGTGDATFAPAEKTSRGMIVSMLYRMAGEPAVTGTASFDDVTPGAWYSKAVIWASQNGISTGTSADRFGPNDIVTREEMVKMLYSYAKHMDNDLSANSSLGDFKDTGSISADSLIPMRWAVSHDIINGVGNGLIAPQGDTTRAQLATIFMQFCENVAK